MFASGVYEDVVFGYCLRGEVRHGSWSRHRRLGKGGERGFFEALLVNIVHLEALCYSVLALAVQFLRESREAYHVSRMPSRA
jgi:hypothetical protein